MVQRTRNRTMGGCGVRARGESIQIDFRYKGVRCRETLRLKPTKSNLAYASNLKAAIEHEIARNTFTYADHFPDSPRAAQFGGVVQSKKTIGAALDDWLEGYEKSVAHSTLESYGKAIKKHLKPVFGHIPIKDLTATQVRAWIASLGISNKSINNALTPLRAVMADAFGDGVISRNPMDRVKALAVRTREPEPFTPDEVSKILANLDGQSKNLYQFAIWTGLRPSELIALQWGDIGDDSVRVRRALVRRQVKETKTIAGMRDVKLLPAALEALNAQKPYTRLKGQEVFQNPRTTKPWVSDKAMREVDWRQALARAKVAYREPYQCRHTYASMLLSAGENPMWVANQMGHRNMTVLLKRYGRWIPEAAPDAGRLVTNWSQGNAKDSVNE